MCESKAIFSQQVQLTLYCKSVVIQNLIGTHGSLPYRILTPKRRLLGLGGCACFATTHTLSPYPMATKPLASNSFRLTLTYPQP